MACVDVCLAPVSENIIALSNASYTQICFYLFCDRKYESRARMNLHVYFYLIAFDSYRE